MEFINFCLIIVLFVAVFREFRNPANDPLKKKTTKEKPLKEKTIKEDDDYGLVSFRKTEWEKTFEEITKS